MPGAGLTDFAEAKALDFYLRNTAYSQAATIYMRLWNVLPNDDGTGGTEVTGDGYIGKAITFGAYSSRRISNSGTVTHTSSGGGWTEAVGFTLSDAASGGNQLAIGTLSPAHTVGAGGSISYLAGEVYVQLNVFGPSLAQKVLDKIFRNVTGAAITPYAALMSVLPDNDGAGGTELSATGYARQLGAFDAFSGGGCNLSSELLFHASAPTAWGAVPGIAWFDAVTGGNFLVKAAFAATPTYGTGARVALRQTGTAITLD